MSKAYSAIRQRTTAFAGRWGFVTRDLFFEFLCPLQRSRKFSFWSDLQTEGLISKSQTVPNVFYLTRRGRRTVVDTTAPGRAIYFVEHDMVLAQLFLSLNMSGLVERYWLERELKTDHMMAHEVLGSSILTKFPDLVIDMTGINGPVRVAFEIERIQKSKHRIQQMAHNYLAARKVGLLVFGCATMSNVEAIERAFRGEVYSKAAKVPATFLMKDFAEKRMATEARYMGYKLTLKRMLLAALKHDPDIWPEGVDKTWISVQQKSTKSETAA